MAVYHSEHDDDDAEVRVYINCADVVYDHIVMTKCTYRDYVERLRVGMYVVIDGHKLANFTDGEGEGLI